MFPPHALDGTGENFLKSCRVSILMLPDHNLPAHVLSQARSITNICWTSWSVGANTLDLISGRLWIANPNPQLQILPWIKNLNKKPFVLILPLL